jgi:hypothetical protein
MREGPASLFNSTTMKNIVLIALFLFTVTSCSFIVQNVILGVRKPKVETDESVSRYLVKSGLTTTNAFFLNDSLYLPLLLSSSGYFSKYEVYNSEFEKIIPTDSLVNKCYGTIYSQLMFIDNQDLWKRDSLSVANINNVFKNVLKLDGTRHHIEKSDQIDYYVVFFWAKFMGNYSSNLLDIAKSLEEKNQSNMRIITVNVDKHVFMNDSLKAVKFDFTK